MIYTILRFFRIHIPKMDSFPMLFSHPTRPPVRPSWFTCFQTGLVSSFSMNMFPKWILSLCYSVTRPGRPSARPPVMDHRLSNWFVFQYFSVHMLSNWSVFQYFSVHRLLKCFVFQYFHNSNSFRRDFHIK